MTQQEKIALLEETLEVDEGTLTPETVLDDVEEYDSMSKLALIVMFEDECGKKISGEEIRAFKTINDILVAMG